MTKLGIRYYDPTLGRFTQPDPTGQDPHYTYARNNPIIFTDPTGAVTFLEGTIIALGAVALGAAILPATPVIATIGIAAGGTAFVFGTACTINDPSIEDC